MNKLRQIALLAAALLSGLSAFGQRLPDTTVNWETEVVTAADGTSRIVFTGTPVVPLDEIHGTLQWISCVGENCHSPEELEYDLHPTASAEDSSDPQAGLTAPPSQAGPLPLHPRADMASGGTPVSADELMQEYLQERWKGMTPVMWGDTLREAEYMQKTNGDEI